MPQVQPVNQNRTTAVAGTQQKTTLDATRLAHRILPNVLALNKAKQDTQGPHVSFSPNGFHAQQSVAAPQKTKQTGLLVSKFAQRKAFTSLLLRQFAKAKEASLKLPQSRRASQLLQTRTHLMAGGG